MSTISCGMHGCRYNSSGFCNKLNVFLNQNMQCTEHIMRDGTFRLNWQNDIQKMQDEYIFEAEDEKS